MSAFLMFGNLEIYRVYGIAVERNSVYSPEGGFWSWSAATGKFAEKGVRSIAFRFSAGNLRRILYVFLRTRFCRYLYGLTFGLLVFILSQDFINRVLGTGGVQLYLAAKLRIKIVGQTFDGVEALQSGRKLEHDVLLLDLGLPGTNSLDVVKELTCEFRRTRIVGCMMLDSEEFVRESMRGGRGYVLKNSSLRKPVEGEERVEIGKVYLDLNNWWVLCRNKPTFRRNRRETIRVVC